MPKVRRMNSGYPKVGKVLILTPEERFALLQALSARRNFLTAPSALTRSGAEQLRCVGELIQRVGYTEKEVRGAERGVDQRTLDEVIW